MIFDTDRISTDEFYREELCFRCETDHWFLAEAIGFRKFHREIHKPVFDELYFGKNNKLAIEDQHPIKKRLHIDPRFSYKTTAGRVDSLQWMLAFPEFITILNESATQPLAAAISESLALFFWKKKSAAPTILQLLYPKLVVEKYPSPTWDLPLHISTDLDTTVAFTSPGSQQAGWHPWIINPDDMVENTNSGINAKPEMREAVKDTYWTNLNTLQPGGYVNVRGTRYHPRDLYGDIINKMAATPGEWLTLIRSSIKVKNGERLLPGEFPDEDDLELNFGPIPGLSYKDLRTKFYDDYESFMSQQQNDPQGGHVPTFDQKMYAATQAEPELMPVMGSMFMCWRLPYAGKKYMTHAEGALVSIHNEKVYVIDSWRGTYPPSGIAERMVRAAREHDIETVMIEASPGSEFMGAHIRNEAQKRNRSLRIQWMDFEEDDNRRFAEIKQLEPFMKSGRLIFSAGMGHAADCREQFVHFGLVEENGIIDCISKLARQVPMSLMRANLTEEEIDYQRRARENAQYSQIFGQMGMPAVDEKARRMAQATLLAMEKLNHYGLPSLPGGLDG